MKQAEAIQSMIALMAVDGRISGQEKEFLKKVQDRYNLPQEIISALLAEAEKGRSRLRIPKDPKERKQLFEMLIQASLADGEIDLREIKILKRVAVNAGIKGINIETYLQSRLKRTLESKSTKTELKPSQKRDCPKCGLEQAADNTTCDQCGIIFAKYNRPSSVQQPAAYEGAQGPVVVRKPSKKSLFGTLSLTTVIVIGVAVFAVWWVYNGYFKKKPKEAARGINIYRTVDSSVDVPRPKLISRGQKVNYSKWLVPGLYTVFVYSADW